MVSIINKRIFILFIASIAFGAMFLFFPKASYAAVEKGDVYGWAWNDNIGWISFNASNTSPNIQNYKVSFDDSGNARTNSYAWSEVVGYIRFDPTDASTNAPIVDTYERRAVHIKFNSSTGRKELFGWARVCSKASNTANCTGGGDGWLKMNGTYGGGSNAYGVWVDKSNSLRGFAYASTTDVSIGWISFNCTEGGTTGGDICGTSNYKASMITNIAGWAWNANVGWISFNCFNSDNPETGDGVEECGGHFYGVNIDPATRRLGGYAWNSNVGWISFESTTTPPTLVDGVAGDPFDFSQHCYDSTSCDGTDRVKQRCTACYNDGRIYGWAKILSLGDAGWISLSSTNTPSTTHNYGVSIRNGGKAFDGWAWNNYTTAEPLDLGIGWIAFSSSTAGVFAGLPTASFAVTADINTPPSVPPSVSLVQYNGHNPTSLTGDWGNIVRNNLCSHLLLTRLVWGFLDSDVGDAQSAYHIQIQEKNGGGNYVDLTPVNQFNIDKDVESGDTFFDFTKTVHTIQYHTEYQYRVKVADSFGVWSDYSDWEEFTTPLHQYPKASSTHFMPDPSAEEQVKFSDASIYYLDDGNTSGDTETTCIVGTYDCEWDWSMAADPTAGSISNHTASSTIITFVNPEDTTNNRVKIKVTDKVTDNEGYYCENIVDINVKKRLPKWRETK